MSAWVWQVCTSVACPGGVPSVTVPSARTSPKNKEAQTQSPHGPPQSIAVSSAPHGPAGVSAPSLQEAGACPCAGCARRSTASATALQTRARRSAQAAAASGAPPTGLRRRRAGTLLSRAASMNSQMRLMFAPFESSTTDTSRPPS